MLIMSGDLNRYVHCAIDQQSFTAQCDRLRELGVPADTDPVHLAAAGLVTELVTRFLGTRRNRWDAANHPWSA
jgi:hypothetical protein